MTPAELVRSTIDFARPGGVPFFVTVDIDRFRRRRPRRDFVELERILERVPRLVLRLHPAPSRTWRPRGGLPEGCCEDEWGVVWKDGLAVGHPLRAGTPDDYAFPDPDAPGRFDEAKRLADENAGRLYVLGHVWFTCFERMWLLSGFDETLVLPYLDEAAFLRLRDRVVDFCVRMVDRWLDLGVDGIAFSDDWGWQAGPLMNPDDWRRWYKPAYERIFSRTREGGAHVWLHSCGAVDVFVEDWIEAGLNVLGPLQPQAMDLGELGRRFSGRVCFQGGVDVQGTLPFGGPDDVRREVDRLVAVLGTPDGGYIGDTSHTILPDTPLENIRALVEAFRRHFDGGAS